MFCLILGILIKNNQLFKQADYNYVGKIRKEGWPRSPALTNTRFDGSYEDKCCSENYTYLSTTQDTAGGQRLWMEMFNKKVEPKSSCPIFNHLICGFDNQTKLFFSSL
jgi:hypothetical protein